MSSAHPSFYYLSFTSHRIHQLFPNLFFYSYKHILHSQLLSSPIAHPPSINSSASIYCYPCHPHLAIRPSSVPTKHRAHRYLDKHAPFPFLPLNLMLFVCLEISSAEWSLINRPASPNPVPPSPSLTHSHVAYSFTLLITCFLPSSSQLRVSSSCMPSVKSHCYSPCNNAASQRGAKWRGPLLWTPPFDSLLGLANLMIYGQMDEWINR